MLYTFLASSCGWTFEQIREMTPGEHGIVIDKLLEIEKQRSKAIANTPNKWVARRQV